MSNLHRFFSPFARGLQPKTPIEMEALLLQHSSQHTQYTTLVGSLLWANSAWNSTVYVHL